MKPAALLLADGFDAATVTAIREALAAAGIDVVLVGATAGAVYRDTRGEVELAASVAAGRVRAADFGAVVIPAGQAADRMRLRHALVDLVAAAADAGVLVAAIGHGPQLLISARCVRGRTLTCWPSIAVDVTNAGGRYVDRPVVRDGNLITSRKTDDVDGFAGTLIQALAERADGADQSTRRNRA